MTLKDQYGPQLILCEHGHASTAENPCLPCRTKRATTAALSALMPMVDAARAEERAAWLAALKSDCIGFTPTNPNASPSEIAKELEHYFAEMYY